MNPDKTEIIRFASHAQSAILAAQGRSLQIGSEVIRAVSVVPVLGVLLDTELTMKPHIAKTAATGRVRQPTVQVSTRAAASDTPVLSPLLSVHSRKYGFTMLP
jgi:hypothetical protein